MHNFGEVVIYVRNGVELNALVLNSRVMGEEEHLSVAYPNMDVKGQMLTSAMVAKAMLTAFDVKPLMDGGINGWKESNGKYARILLNRIEQLWGKDGFSAIMNGKLPTYAIAAFNTDSAQIGPKANPPSEIPAANVPFETKHYADGSSATGPAPLPELSPEEQKAKAAIFSLAQGKPGDNQENGNAAITESAAMKAYREARQKDAEPDVATQLDAAGPAPEPEAPPQA